MADLILPAAAWGEKAGTFINSERRIGVVRRVSNPPGIARPDFDIFRALAETWSDESRQMFSKWKSPEAVFRILQRCSEGQPCDISGIDGYADIESYGGIQWPFPRSTVAKQQPPEQQRRLFSDGKFFTSSGRARFVFDAPRALPEPPDETFPLLLLTGRGSSAQWHTETRTSRSAILRKMHPSELLIEIHPRDAREFGIASGSKVQVTSRRASLTAIARITPTVRSGEVFLPMHDSRVNQLTQWVVDPHSRQPAFKACAVSVLPQHKNKRWTLF